MIKPFCLHAQNLRPLEAGPLAPNLVSFVGGTAAGAQCPLYEKDMGGVGDENQHEAKAEYFVAMITATAET